MSFHSNGPVAFDAISAVVSTPAVEPGTRMWHGGREYVYVYNQGNSQISVYKACTAMLSSATSSTMYSVTVSTTTQNDLVIGFCRNATITTNTYGWVVVKGTTTVDTGTTVIAAGGLGQVAANGGVAPATNLTSTQGQWILKVPSTITSSTGLAWVSCDG